MTPDLFERLDDESVPVARVDHQRRIARALAHIQDHLGDELELNALARVASMSPSHFGVVFRGLLGESVWQYVKRHRLERAATFLRLTDEPVIQIALACGFQSHEAFTRAFGKAFGCSPRTFRRKARPTTLPAPTGLHFSRGRASTDFTPIPDRSPDLDVRFVELPPRRLAYVRRYGEYEEGAAAWPRLLWWAWRRGRLRPGVRFFGLAYDDELVTPPDKLRYDACLQVEDDFPGDGSILAQTVPGGLHAVCTVRGTFQQFFETSDTFFCQWLPRSGCTLRAWYEMHEYHPPPGSWSPVRVVIETVRRPHVDIYLPVGPGAFGHMVRG